MIMPCDPAQLASRFDAPSVQALVLVGSYARGDAGPFSDIDLIRFVADQAAALPDNGSHLIDGRLVVVSEVRPPQVAEWFSRPEEATAVVGGLRTARPLIDRDGAFAAIQARARAFTWDAEMQRRANAYAGQRMVGWIEEVHKGLEGLRRGDVGRMLNARFGLSWGLSHVVQVQRGVLLSGDNAFFTEIEAAVGADTEWARLRRMVFGVTADGEPPPSLRDQVGAGLRLYALTADLLKDSLQPPDALLIHQTAALIRATLTTAEQQVDHSMV
jgi:hypothetical protein